MSDEIAPGTVIRDPTKLRAGMRIREGEWDATVLGREDCKEYLPSWLCDSGTLQCRVYDIDIEENGVTFLGWATDPKPAPAPEPDEERHGHVVTWPVEFEPNEEPKPQPFKRHPNCKQDHSQPALCLICEGLIWRATRKVDETTAALLEDGRITNNDAVEASSWRRSQHWTPSASGLGGTACSGLVTGRRW